MNHYDELIDFSETDSSDLSLDTGASRFLDEYESYPFEAMALVPFALTAFVSHQYSDDL
jgi:hypothetical protein